MNFDLSKDMFSEIPENEEDYRIKIEIYKNSKLLFSEKFDYDEITIGRNSSTNKPDIDLIPFDPEKKLSRKTLIIYKENEENYLKNTSKHSIYVNKNKISPEEKVLLKKENKIILPTKIGLKVLIFSEESFEEKEKIKGEMLLFDTNALIEHLELLENNKNNEILMPAMVLEELDNLSHRTKIQEKARKALKKAINLIAEKKIHEPVFAKLSIMPEEYQDSRNNDNLILAIAYEHQKYKDVNLVTSDNYLIQKSRSLGIKAYKPEEIKELIL